MPGPGGELCGTCYYFEAEHSRCQIYAPAPLPPTQAPMSLAGVVRKRPYWPTVAPEDWCGAWKSIETPGTGQLATGGMITPKNTPYTIPGGGAWSHFKPGVMYGSSILYNTELANDALKWSIPGVFDPGTTFRADYSVFGSIDYQNTAHDIEWTLGGADNLPFTDDVAQRVDITNQVDDIGLPFGFAGGPALSQQAGEVRVLCKATDPENITVRMLFAQIEVTVL